MYVYIHTLIEGCMSIIFVAAEKQILTGEQTIFLKKTLSIEITLKKGETTEPRVLVSPPY